MIQISPTDNPPSCIPRQTLIIDDDPVSREALLKIVRLIGLQATAAVSVAEGMRALDPPPHNVVLDLMLPDGSGIDVLRHIRHRRLPIRVALLTGAARPLIARARALQPDAVFVKPVDLRPLLDWLKAG